MTITRCTKTDYDQIVSELADFWGHNRNRSLHHPMYVDEFRDSAYVIRDHEKVVAYLLGFFAQAEPIGYIHLVAVRRSHHLGLARQLYDHFAAFAVSRGCTALKPSLHLKTPGRSDFINLWVSVSRGHRIPRGSQA
jgi:GNAT superfamily N-acetyltransferase